MTHALTWCVKTPLSMDGEIYVEGDEARIGQDGSLAIVQHAQANLPELLNLAFAAGRWLSVHVMDGAADKPAAVKIWKGEVTSEA